MRDNKFTRQMRLFERLQALGFTLEECQALRRIEMTLRRWAEQECGDGNAHASWSIERDEDGVPFRVVHPHSGKAPCKPVYTRIADREAGALKRLKAILAACNERNKASGWSNWQPVHAYHQGDCRGASIYIVPASAIPAGAKLDSCYTSGIAVAA